MKTLYSYSRIAALLMTFVIVFPLYQYWHIQIPFFHIEISNTCYHILKTIQWKSPDVLFLIFFVLLLIKGEKGTFVRIPAAIGVISVLIGFVCLFPVDGTINHVCNDAYNIGMAVSLIGVGACQKRTSTFCSAVIILILYILEKIIVNVESDDWLFENRVTLHEDFHKFFSFASACFLYCFAQVQPAYKKPCVCPENSSVNKKYRIEGQNRVTPYRTETDTISFIIWFVFVMLLYCIPIFISRFSEQSLYSLFLLIKIAIFSLVLMPLLFAFRSACLRLVRGEVTPGELGKFCRRNYFRYFWKYIIYFTIMALMLGGIVMVVLIVVFSSFSEAGDTIENLADYVSLLLVVTFQMYIYFTYAMTVNILNDNPTMSVIHAMKASRKMMDGNKKSLFSLYLSYIGWYVLSLYTCLMSNVWLLPNVFSATALYYDKLIKETNQDEAIIIQ